MARGDGAMGVQRRGSSLGRIGGGGIVIGQANLEVAFDARSMSLSIGSFLSISLETFNRKKEETGF